MSHQRRFTPAKHPAWQDEGRCPRCRDFIATDGQSRWCVGSVPHFWGRWAEAEAVLLRFGLAERMPNGGLLLRPRRTS